MARPIAQTPLQAYALINLHEPLPSGDERYVQLDAARRTNNLAEALVERIVTLEELATSSYARFLVTGHRGCGKTTELYRLKELLTEQNYAVVYFDVEEELNLQDLNWWNILLELVWQIDEQLSQPPYSLSIPDDLREAATEWLAQVITKTTERTDMEASLSTQFDAKAELPFFLKVKAAVKSLIKTGSSDLKEPPCHLIYTLPFALLMSGKIEEEFPSPFLMPMLHIRHRDRREDKDAINAMREILELRVAPDLFAPGVVELLARASGGHIRDFLSLAREAGAQAGRNSQISQEHAKRAIRALADLYNRTIRQEFIEPLDYIVQHDELPGGPHDRDLINLLLVLEYRNDETWFALHPCVEDAPYARRQALERLDLEEERLPLFIALRDFNRFLDEEMQGQKIFNLNPNLLLDFLNKHIQDIAPHLDLSADFFSRQLRDGHCVVLFDGLDEVADPYKRARVAEAVALFIRHYRGNRFIVTSRPRGYEGEVQQRLASLYKDCTICDFDDTDMSAFAQSWYAAVIRDRMGETPDALAEAQRQADDLLRAIHADNHVKALASNPLLLSVLAMVHQQDVMLPQRRAELYDECTDMLLGYWDQIKGGEAARELASHGNLVRGEKRALLEPIALWLHERGEQGLEAKKDELEREIARQFIDIFGDTEQTARDRARLFLKMIDERAELLVERETGTYTFAHLTFQEYLAARAIADRADYVDYTLRHLHDPWWQEVILLEVGHLSDVRNFRRARELTRDLIRAIRDAGRGPQDLR